MRKRRALKIFTTLVILTSLTGSLGLVLTAGAADDTVEPIQNPNAFLDKVGTNAGYNTTVNKETGLAQLLGALVKTLIIFIGVIFICYLIYGGYVWLTAAGSDEKIDKAKKIIIRGFIGLVIILSAAAIYRLVLTALATGPEVSYDPKTKGQEIYNSWQK